MKSTPKNIDKILLVDDQGSIRSIVRKMLTKLGCNVLEAADGAQAIQELREHDEIQLILSDLTMKEMDGLELLKLCRNEYPDLPFVLMTSSSGDEVIVDALRLGACDYIVKPFDLPQIQSLLERIAKLYEERNLAQNVYRIVDEVKLSFTLPSKDLWLSDLQKMVQNTIENHTNLSRNEILNFSMALEEAVLNAHEHGNLELRSEWKDEFSDDGAKTKFEITKDIRLQLAEYAERRLKMALLVNDRQVQFSVEDEGNGYLHTDIASEAPGTAYGMGLMIINNLMDKIQFNDKGNKITFVKQLDGEK